MHSADINLDIGFVPDMFMLMAMEDTTNPNLTLWWDEMANMEDAGDQNGCLMDGNGTTNIAYCAASQGITEYDTAAYKAKIPAVDGHGFQEATIYGDYAYGKSVPLTPTARTTSVLGSVIRPTTKNGFVYECTAGEVSMAALTEPTWPVIPGDTVSDGSNTWICREERLVKSGHKGVTIASELQTNGEYAYWIAFKSVQHKDDGDAANW